MKSSRLSREGVLLLVLAINPAPFVVVGCPCAQSRAADAVFRACSLATSTFMMAAFWTRGPRRQAHFLSALLAGDVMMTLVCFDWCFSGRYLLCTLAQSLAIRTVALKIVVGSGMVPHAAWFTVCSVGAYSGGRLAYTASITAALRRLSAARSDELKWVMMAMVILSATTLGAIAIGYLDWDAVRASCRVLARSLCCRRQALRVADAPPPLQAVLPAVYGQGLAAPAGDDVGAAAGAPRGFLSEVDLEASGEVPDLPASRGSHTEVDPKASARPALAEFKETSLPATTPEQDATRVVTTRLWQGNAAPSSDRVRPTDGSSHGSHCKVDLEAELSRDGDDHRTTKPLEAQQSSLGHMPTPFWDIASTPGGMSSSSSTPFVAGPEPTAVAPSGSAELPTSNDGCPGSGQVEDTAIQPEDMSSLAYSEISWDI